MLQKFKKGFTLIEIMVVISIIGILTVVVIGFLRTPREKSYDARRESDIKQIENALNLYIASNGTFPVCVSEVVVDGSSDCLSLAFNASVPRVIPTTPVDPVPRGSTCGGATTFQYCYISSASGQTYELRYHLGTDTVPGKPQGWWTIVP
jgi:prepilin-type N-terminal cleavage/methylation domain-containing protein